MPVPVVVSNVGANVNIEVKQGKRWYLEITYRDANEVVVDLSSHTAALVVRTGRRLTDTLLLEIAPTTAATAPNIVIDVSWEVMAALEESGVYDLDIIDASDRPTAIWYGDFGVVGEV